jgi:hypothetical protein
MRDKLLINDIHLGVQRVAGTTPATAVALQSYLARRLDQTLSEHHDKDVIINGDLFDSFFVPMSAMLDFYHSARAWLVATETPLTERVSDQKLVLGRGNHDWSKDSAKLSSFDVVGQILKAEFEDRVMIVTEPQWLERDIYMIPHMPNQDLFNLALDKALVEIDANPVRGPAILLLHANYDNNFALESDHSLNVSREQAEKLMAKGWKLVFGHEHQARRVSRSYCVRTNTHEWGVIITGNQWPSSVADCLNNPDDKKYAHVIKGSELVPVLTWDAREEFLDIDWRDLAAVAPDVERFIRVSGKASAAEAPAMLQTIANFRRSSHAFVVSNAVQVEGLGDMAALAVSMEDVRGFDVLGYLLEQLDERQRAVVQSLLKQHERLEEEVA